MTTHFRTVDVDGTEIFYREAGDRSRPSILLLHGFPTSSHMFRNLIPQLADRYHVVAPDLPGFGFTRRTDRASFPYTFARLAEVIDRFTEVLGLKRFALLRLRLRRAGRLSHRTQAPRPHHRAHLAERERL